MNENACERCKSCSHSDLYNYYCYAKRKPIESINDAESCDEWEEYWAMREGDGDGN